MKTKIDQDSTTYQNFPPKESKLTFTTFPQKWLENVSCKTRAKGEEKISDWNTTNYVTFLSHSASIYHKTSTIFSILGKEVTGYEPSQLIIEFHPYYTKYQNNCSSPSDCSDTSLSLTRELLRLQRDEVSNMKSTAAYSKCANYIRSSPKKDAQPNIS